MTPAVLGIDSSLTRAGVALLARDPDTTRIARLADIGYSLPDSASYAERNERIEAQAGGILRIVKHASIDHDLRIDLAVFEGPLYGMKTLPSYFDRSILWGALYSLIHHMGIPIAVVSPSTREKFITGVGSKGNKPLVLKEMRAAWSPDNPHRIENHDQADALGLATAGAIHLGWKMPFRLRRCHVENVATITWPEIPQAS